MVRCIDCPHFSQDKDSNDKVRKDKFGRDINKCRWERFGEGDPQYLDPMIEFDCGWEKIGVDENGNHKE